MIVPRKVKFEAKKKENENLEFRTFLKCHADETELDKQFKRLHDELFSNYDCSRCRNCCKMYYGSIPSEDLERDAEFLNLTKEQFVERYLIKNEVEDTYETKNKPCDFLQEDGNCKLGECRPESCKNILIRINRIDCRACIVCLMRWKSVRWRLRYMRD